MASEDDTAYKQLFAYPEMVRDLLLGFVPGEWVHRLDLTSFERVNGSYVSDGGHHRHSDMVWRVRLAGEWIYIYLLLEFQSRSDHWMALRMQVYIGLLYQDLVKRHELPQAGRLPPVFPVVLYNGKRPWKASLNLAELVTAVPSDLRYLQAAQQYLLIDQQRLSSAELAMLNNVAALVFRIERAHTVSDLVLLLEKLQRDVTASVLEDLGRWGARHLRRLAGARIIKLQSSMERCAVMATREFKTYGDIFRDEAELFGHKDRLKMLLVKRFGKLSRKLSSRIDWADRKDVDLWFDRFLDAKNIKEVFVEDQPA